MATIEEEQLAQLMAQQEGFGFSPRENIYGSIGSGIASALPKMVNPYGSTGSNIATVLGGSLVAGLLGYQARQEAEERNKALMPVFTDVLGARDMPTLTAAISGVDPDIARKLTPYVLQQATTLRAQEAAQEQRLAERAQDLQDYMFKQQYTSGLEEEKTNRLLARLDKEETQVLEDDLNPEQPSLSQMRKDLTRQLAGVGTPGQTFQQVRFELAPIAQETNLRQKELLDFERKVDDMEAIIAQASRAIEKGGATGGPTLVKFIRDKVRDYQQYFDEDALEEVSARGNFVPIMARMVQILRSPGAVSDFETKMLSRAAPSTDNTKGQNKELLDFIKAQTSLYKKRNEFYRKYVSQKNHLRGSIDAWDRYLKDTFGDIDPRSSEGRKIKMPNISSWASGALSSLPTIPGAATESTTSDIEEARQLYNDPLVPEEIKNQLRPFIGE